MVEHSGRGSRPSAWLGWRIAVLVSLLLSACYDKATVAEHITQPVVILEGKTMGTRWSVQLVPTHAVLPYVGRAELKPGQSADSGRDSGALEQALLDELDRINRLMSTWDPESELSRFNRSTSIEPQTLNPDTLKVIDTARVISGLTAGRYEITLGPVIDLWGFGPDLSSSTPSDEQLHETLSFTGRGQLVRIGATVRKRDPRVRVDLSSLAKGYAVDQLGVVLEGFGVTDYLVDIGGELRARGHRAAGVPWKVGIETPDGQVDAGLALVNTHIASSGSYRNYREVNGRRLSHIIDGLSGKPIDHALVAVTVVHESTMLADAWATALLVVGEQRARSLIEQLHLAAQLTVRVGAGYQVYRSPSFSSLVLESS